MSNGFVLHDSSTAPADSQETLEEAREKYGTVPNLEAVMATSPPLLKAYEMTSELFGQTSLSPAEQEVVAQTVNVHNSCDYCVPWHTLLSKTAGLDDGEVQALRAGRPLSNEKLEALRRFTAAFLRANGNIESSELNAFLNAGYSRRQALEVVLGIATKVMSNYTNSIAAPPLDDPITAHAWDPSEVEGTSPDQAGEPDGADD